MFINKHIQSTVTYFVTTICHASDLSSYFPTVDTYMLYGHLHNILQRLLHGIHLVQYFRSYIQTDLRIHVHHLPKILI